VIREVWSRQVGAALLLLTLAQPEGSAAIKLVCYLEASKAPGDLELRIENPAPQALAAVIGAELVLEPSDRPELRDPLVPQVSYRARLGLSGATAVSGTSAARIAIPALSSKAWRVRPGDLAWHKKESAIRAPDGAFRSVVPPGQFELFLLLQHSESGDWSSRALGATVDAQGRLEVRSPATP
jgi:hypothetical protein